MALSMGAADSGHLHANTEYTRHSDRKTAASSRSRWTVISSPWLPGRVENATREVWLVFRFVGLFTFVLLFYSHDCFVDTTHPFMLWLLPTLTKLIKIVVAH